MDFFDGIISTSPPDCKTNEYHFVSLGHFPNMRQIQNVEFFAGVPIWKNFDIIKYNRILYIWMVHFMLINFYKRTNTQNRSFLRYKRIHNTNILFSRKVCLPNFLRFSCNTLPNHINLSKVGTKHVLKYILINDSDGIT